MANQKKYLLPEIVQKKSVVESIKSAAAQNVKQNFDPWLKKALIAASQSQQIVDYCSTENGALKVVGELAKAASAGMQIGGMYEQGYLTIISGKPAFIAKDSGMAFESTYGPGAVLKHPPTIIEVYEADVFRFENGVVKHECDPFADRGKIIGYYAKLDYKSGISEYEFCSMQKVEKIKEKMGLANRSSWKNWPDEMSKKTAAKQILKKATAMSDGLANMIENESEYEEPETIEERAADRLDDIIDVTPEPEPENEPEPEVELDEEEPII